MEKNYEYTAYTSMQIKKNLAHAEDTYSRCPN